LHARLRADPRVTNLEQINARHLQPGQLPRDAFDLVVIDVSFISLRTILPAVWPFVPRGGRLIALVKPQFEAGREEVDKGRGVIRDPAVQQAVLDDVRTFALALPGATLIGAMDSPITGTDGNREFLIGLLRSADRPEAPVARG
jgi:23S rRNA (cytidine1920-2'-O)/16S rRNA (cytidine1409-2'-O)-methyltransferase